MDIIKVVCGVIFNNDKIFICRRKKGKSLAGFWEFPGGKIEENETHLNALRRELLEELEMEIKIIDFIGQSFYNYGNFKIQLYGYKCLLINYNGKLTDHDSFEWIDVETLNKYKLAPADVSFIKMIDKQKAPTYKS